MGGLPPTPATHGVRGLGRLALAEHFAAVRDRLQAALARFTSPDPLADAGRVTGYGVRSSSPRVFIVGSLSGGTGSGMLVDLSFLVRRLLRGQRLSAEHVVGLLALPPPGPPGRRRPTPGGRSTTSLTTTGRTRSTRPAWTDPAMPAADAGRPFRRCGLLAPEGAAALAAHLVFAEALAPGSAGCSIPTGRPFRRFRTHSSGCGGCCGRATGCSRGSPGSSPATPLPGWAGPPQAATMDAVAKAVDREWTDRRLGVELMRTGVEYGASQKLGGPIDSLLQEIVPVLPAAPGAAGPDIPTAGAALDRLAELLGTPDGDGSDGNGRVAAALETRANELATAADAKLVSLVVSQVERPGHRVAAAQEAVHLLGERLSAALATIERESAGLADESRAGFTALRELLTPPVLASKSACADSRSRPTSRRGPPSGPRPATGSSATGPPPRSTGDCWQRSRNWMRSSFRWRTD